MPLIGLNTEDRGNEQRSAGTWRESDLPYPFPPGLDLGGIRYLLSQADVTTLNVDPEHVRYIQQLRTRPGLAEAILRGPPIVEPRDPSDEEYDCYLRGLELREYAFVPFTYTGSGDDFHQRCEARLMREREQERLQTLEAQVLAAEENLRVQQERIDQRRVTLRIRRDALDEARRTGDFRQVHIAFTLAPFTPPPPPPYTSAYRRQFEEADRAAAAAAQQQQQQAKRQRTGGPTALGVTITDPSRAGPSGIQPSISGAGPSRQVRFIPVGELHGESHLPPYRRTSSRQRIALTSYATLAELVVQDENNTAATRVSASQTERQNRRRLEDLELASLRSLVSRLQADRHVRGDPYPTQAEVDYQEQVDWYLQKQSDREASQRREAEAKQRKLDEQARAERAARFEREEEEIRRRSGSGASRGGRGQSRDRHPRDRRDSYEQDRDRPQSRPDSRESTGSRQSTGRQDQREQSDRGRGRGANAVPLGTRGKSLAPPKGPTRTSEQWCGTAPGTEPESSSDDELASDGYNARRQPLKGPRVRRPSRLDTTLEFGGPGTTEQQRRSTKRSSTEAPPSSHTGETTTGYDPVTRTIRQIRLEQEQREAERAHSSQGESPLLPPTAPTQAHQQQPSMTLVLGDPAYERRVAECQEKLAAYYRGDLQLSSVEYTNLLYFLKKYDTKVRARNEAIAQAERQQVELEETLRINREQQQILAGAVTTPIVEVRPWPATTSAGPSTQASTSAGQTEQERMVVDPLATSTVPTFVTDTVTSSWAEEPIDSPPDHPTEPLGADDGADRPDVDIINFPQHGQTWREQPDDRSQYSDSTALLSDHPSQAGDAYQPGYYQETGGSSGQPSGAAAQQQPGGGRHDPAISGLVSPTRRSARIAELASPGSGRSQSTDRTERLIRSPSGSVSATDSNAGRAARSASVGGREVVVRPTNDGQGVLHPHSQRATGEVPRPHEQQGAHRAPTEQDGGGVSTRGRTQQRLPPDSPRSTARRRGGPVDKSHPRNQK